MRDAYELIAEERMRQVAEEGYMHAKDDCLVTGELALAASSYCQCVAAVNRGMGEAFGKYAGNEDWPFTDPFKPKPDQIENLVRAGALIVAEIERLQRLRGKP